MSPKRRRLTIVVLGLLLLGGAVALVLSAFQENLVFFFSPTELAEKHVDAGRRIRIGGMVEKGSVETFENGLRTDFVVTDFKHSLKVTYRGALPDLFREGQGVVAEGTYDGKEFTASEVLAKHDEKYMPPEVADALKKSGAMKEDGTVVAQ